MSKLAGYESGHPRKFKVTITETLKRTVEVDADDQYDAEQMVSDGWHGSKYILGSEDFIGVEFAAVPVENGQTAMVTFEYNGVKYTMTKQEIEAAYRYRQHQYRLEDAQRHLNILAFGSDDGSDFDDPESERAKAAFAETHGISYEEASSNDMLEEYVRRFEDGFDCNCDENRQWEAAILGAL